MPPLFDTDFEPNHGELVEVSPLLRRIVCNNPSKFTFHGTGTYVIGHGDVAIVDPGPRDDEHVAALLAALDGERVHSILITHTHGDHSPAAAAVKDATGAPILGFGPHPSVATSEGDEDVADDADWDTGEERKEMTDEEKANAKADHLKHLPDVDFAPDQRLAHGDIVDGPGWTVEALHTPGHISNHLCFALAEEQAVLSGDHVMGWSTTIIPPPDGDLRAYLRSLELLLDRDDATLYPTHGGAITKPKPFVKALLDHRRIREEQILRRLAEGPQSVREIVEVLYAEVARELWRPAARSVISHLIALRDAGRVETAVSDASVLATATTWVRP
ncbi:MAG: MBL fold metallo-hydrolase [Acidimicrobiales bacterium]|nr:MAG: MBL fold metallo-hydrolase [Acidimicrobiales bacterium]